MENNSDHVLVLTTLPANADGRAFGFELVERQVAACVNLLPVMESIYRWQGAVEQEAERQVLMKTRRDRVPALWEAVRALHTYDTPEFVVLPIAGGSDAYLSWITASTAGS